MPSSAGAVITASGTPGNGDVLTYGASAPEWKALTAFSFYDEDDHFSPAGFVLPIPFNSTDYNYNGTWDGETYTVPESGLYHFDAKVTVQTTAAVPQTARIVLYINGSEYRGSITGFHTTSISQPLTLSLDCELTAGDEVEVRFENSDVGVFVHGADKAWFSGHRIR